MQLYERADRKVQGISEPVTNPNSGESAVSFIVFPALLAEVATKLFPDSSGQDARQRLMRKGVLPLSVKIAKLLDERQSAAQQVSSPKAVVPASAPTSPMPELAPTAAAPPPASPPAQRSSPRAAATANLLSSPLPASPQGVTSVPPSPQRSVASPGAGSAVGFAVQPQPEYPPLPSSAVSGSRDDTRAPALATQDDAVAVEPIAPPPVEHPEAALLSAAAAALNTSSSSVPAATAASTSSEVPLPASARTPKSDRATAAATQVTIGANGLPRFMQPTKAIAGVGHLAGGAGIRSRSASAERDGLVDASAAADAPSSAAVGAPVVGAAPVPAATVQAFIQRQFKAEEERKTRASARALAVQSAETNGNGVPKLSEGTRKILARLQPSGGFAPPAVPPAATLAQMRIQSFQQLTTAATAIDAAAWPSVSPALPTTPTGKSAAAALGRRPAAPPAAAAGEALYRNAMNRLDRQKALIQETMAEEQKMRNGKKASGKSESLVRRRLAREVAAACVYIAAQRSSGVYQYNTSSSANADGSSDLLPWWLLGLTAGDAATVLHHLGFFSGSPLAHAAASRAVSILCAPGADPAHDALPIAQVNPNAAAVPDDGDITAAIADNCRSLAKVWRAATGGLPYGDGNVVLPAVRLLALLQSLVTGAYDVRPEVLTSASSDIGMDQPFVLIRSSPQRAGVPSSPVRGAGRDGTISVDGSPAQAPLAAVSANGMNGIVHSDVPAAFAAVLSEHTARLRALQDSIDADGNDPLSASLRAAARAEAGDHGIPMPSAATAGLAVAVHPLADDVISARTLFAGSVLAPLKQLYTNRLSYLTILTRDDGKRAIAVAASRDIVAARGSEGAGANEDGNGGGNGVADAFVRAADARGGAMAAMASEAAAGANLGHGPLLRQRGPLTSRNMTAAQRYDEEECTFAPLLCKKSLALASRRESAMMADINSNTDSPTAAATGAGGGAEGSPSVPPSSSPANGNIITIPREVLMMKYKADVEERNEALRALKEAAEMAHCTFKPDTSASQGAGSSSSGNDGGMDGIHGSGGAGFGRSRAGNSLAGVYVPNYSSLVQAAVNSVPGAHIPAHRAAETPWIAKASRLDALSMANKSRNDWLYHLASVRDTAISHAHELHLQAKESIEMDGCTFKPQTNWAKSKAFRGRVGAASAAAGASGVKKGKAIQNSKNDSNGGSGAANVVGATDYFAFPSNDEAGGRHDNEADQWAGRGNVTGIDTNRTSSIDGDGASADYDHFDEQDLNGSAVSDDSAVEVEVDVDVGTDAALLLASEPVQPHLAASRNRGGTPGRPGAAPSSSAAANGAQSALSASGALGNTNGKATVTVSHKLARGAKGLDTHLKRILKGRAEKEERKRMDAALSAGVLHKRAVVRDNTGRTVMKPFAFVTEFRALAHDGHVLAGEPSQPPSTNTSYQHQQQQMYDYSDVPAPMLPVPSSSSTAAAVSVGGDHHGASSAPVLAAPPAAQGGPSSYRPPFDPPAAGAPASVTGTGSIINDGQSSAVGGGGLGSSHLGSSHASHTQTLTFPAGEPPLMYVDVTVSAGTVERIPVWRDSDLKGLAAEFAAKHGLTRKMARRLEKMIASEAHRAGISLAASGIMHQEGMAASTVGHE